MKYEIGWHSHDACHVAKVDDKGQADELFDVALYDPEVIEDDGRSAREHSLAALTELIERANGTINLLCIRDPDWTNEYVSDAPINEITIDIGGSWRDFKHFAGELADGDLEAVQYEAHILAEVAGLAPENPVRKRAEEFFSDARQVGA